MKRTALSVSARKRVIAAAMLTMLPMLLCPAADVFAATTCTLIVDAATGATQVRVGERCDERQTPASSFKVPLALIGFDSGILQDSDQPAWPYREEYAAWDELWERTTTPTSWMRDSVVWYSQELTRRLGAGRFKEYVDRLDYGNRDVSGHPGRGDGLTTAWLMRRLLVAPSEARGVYLEFREDPQPEGPLRPPPDQAAAFTRSPSRRSRR